MICSRKGGSTCGKNRYPSLGVPVRIALVARAGAVSEPVPHICAGRADRYPSGTPPVPQLAGTGTPPPIGAEPLGEVPRPNRSILRNVAKKGVWHG